MNRFVYFIIILVVFISTPQVFSAFSNISLVVTKTDQVKTSKPSINQKQLILQSLNSIRIINKTSSKSPTKFDQLNLKIQTYLKDKQFERYISISNSSGETINVNESSNLDALSLIKFVILLTAYDLRENEGINFDTSVYKFGYEGTLDTALHDMTIYSSNEATGAVLTLVTTSKVNEFIKKYLGKTDIYLDHTPGYAGVEDENYSQENIVNTKDLNRLLVLFFNNKIFPNSVTEEIKDILYSADDYYNLKEIFGETKYYIKAGYAPNTHFAFTGSINTKKYGQLTLTVYFTSDEGLELNEISNFVKLISE